MNDLSSKQQQILEYMKAEVREKGYPPSVREICEAVGLKSTSTVHGHLARLEKKGYIRRDPTKPRAIEILDEAPHNPDLPTRELVQVPPSLPWKTSRIPSRFPWIMSITILCLC